MSAPSVVIAGCGDVGSRLASQLLASEWEVHGLRRDISRLPDGVIGIAGDLFKKDCPDTWPIGGVDYLVYCAAATDHDEAGYRAAYVQGLQHVLEWLNDYGQEPKHLLFVSSSSVYGQQNGEWVDETSETRNKSSSNLFASRTSNGRRISTPFSFARRIISPAKGILSSSSKERPMLCP